MLIEPLIQQRIAGAVEFRHRLHRIPELAFHEYKTAEAIRGELDRLGIAWVAGPADAPTATVAWLGDVEKPCVAFRADIDALPIVERTGLAYASTHPGVMHACGHDGHSATLMGMAGVFKAIESQLPVCVKLIWQPAEEGGGGAARLVEAGVLDGRIGPRVTAIFGLHGWPGMKVGMVATRPGALLAATDNFSATFLSVGCHGAFPHLAPDPIVTAAETVINLQQLVSRELDPTEPGVVTVGKFNAGTAVNIIPESASIHGTVRTLSDEARQKMRVAVERRCAAMAAASGCEMKFEWTPGYPATINDPRMAEYVAEIARKTVGAENYFAVARPAMGGEDFAYYLEKVPGCFFMVGVEPVEAKTYPSLHTDRYDFTDEAIGVGMRMFAGLALGWGDGE